MNPQIPKVRFILIFGHRWVSLAPSNVNLGHMLRVNDGRTELSIRDLLFPTVCIKVSLVLIFVTSCYQSLCQIRWLYLPSANLLSLLLERVLSRSILLQTDALWTRPTSSNTKTEAARQGR